MEDSFFKPTLENSPHSLKIADQFLDNKITPAKLKKVLNRILQNFNLEKVKFSVSNKKNGHSYYSASKNTIFINKFYIDHANQYYIENKNIILTNEFIFNDSKRQACLALLHVIIHEISHAYTYLFFNEDSYHDSIFFNNHLSILKYITKHEDDYLFNTEQKIKDNDYIREYYKTTLNEYLKNQFILFKLSKKHLNIEKENNHKETSFKHILNFMDKNTFRSSSSFVEYENHIFGGLFQDYHIDVKIFKNYNSTSIIDFKGIELKENKQKDIFLNHVTEN